MTCTTTISILRRPLRCSPTFGACPAWISAVEEGHNTRLRARAGAHVSAIDISDAFIRHALSEEDRAPLNIDHRVGSAVVLPFEDGTFDFAVAFMSLMDMPPASLR